MQYAGEELCVIIQRLTNAVWQRITAIEHPVQIYTAPCAVAPNLSLLEALKGSTRRAGVLYWGLEDD